jgi:hypothetical protein
MVPEKSKDAAEIALSQSGLLKDGMKLEDTLSLISFNHTQSDKDRIYKDGKQANGYSEEYDIVYDILMWKCDSSQFAMLLVEILQMLDVNFFMESHRILEMIREVTMARKMQTLGQK